MTGSFRYNTFYNEFLSENPTMEKLTFNSEELGPTKITNPKKLQKMLPSLNEIRFLDNGRINRKMEHWVKDLKTVKFCRADAKDEIRKMPVDEWQYILERSRWDAFKLSRGTIEYQCLNENLYTCPLICLLYRSMRNYLLIFLNIFFKFIKI